MVDMLRIKDDTKNINNTICKKINANNHVDSINGPFNLKIGSWKHIITMKAYRDTLQLERKGEI